MGKSKSSINMIEQEGKKKMVREGGRGVCEVRRERETSVRRSNIAG